MKNNISGNRRGLVFFYTTRPIPSDLYYRLNLPLFIYTICECPGISCTYTQMLSDSTALPARLLFFFSFRYLFNPEISYFFVIKLVLFFVTGCGLNQLQCFLDDLTVNVTSDILLLIKKVSIYHRK